MRFLLLFVGCSLFLGACDPAPPTPDRPQQAMESAPKPTDEKQAPRASLAELEASMNTAKAAYEKAPTDEKLKAAYVDELVVYGEAVMTADELPPKDKYPQSLKLFREAKTLDPKNTLAKQNIDMIESIYKDMGRPIPQ